MSSIEIKFDEIVDHGARFNDDWNKITVVVNVNYGGNNYSLNLQSKINHNYKPTSEFGLNSSSGDQADELAKCFDYIDSDGDEVEGEDTDIFESIIRIAIELTKDEINAFFDDLPDRPDDYVENPYRDDD